MAKNNKNRKFTFNIIDALIILVLVAIIALIVYVFILNKDLSDLNPYSEKNTTTESIKIIEPSTCKQVSLSNTYFYSDVNIGENLL